jgi:hypothetical protein
MQQLLNAVIRATFGAICNRSRVFSNRPTGRIRTKSDAAKHMWQETEIKREREREMQRERERQRGKKKNGDKDGERERESETCYQKTVAQ